MLQHMPTERLGVYETLSRFARVLWEHVRSAELCIRSLARICGEISDLPLMKSREVEDPTAPMLVESDFI